MPGAEFSDASWAFDAAEFGTGATWQSQQPSAAAVPGVVLLDAPGALSFEGLRSTDYSALYQVVQWSSVREGDRVTIGAAIYEVREVLPIDDGLLARAALRRLN